jgi:hypothetical protein
VTKDAALTLLLHPLLPPTPSGKQNTQYITITRRNSPYPGNCKEAVGRWEAALIAQHHPPVAPGHSCPANTPSKPHAASSDKVLHDMLHDTLRSNRSTQQQQHQKQQHQSTTRGKHTAPPAPAPGTDSRVSQALSSGANATLYRIVAQRTNEYYYDRLQMSLPASDTTDPHLLQPTIPLVHSHQRVRQ